MSEMGCKYVHQAVGLNDGTSVIFENQVGYSSQMLKNARQNKSSIAFIKVKRIYNRPSKVFF